MSEDEVKAKLLTLEYCIVHRDRKYFLTRTKDREEIDGKAYNVRYRFDRSETPVRIPCELAKRLMKDCNLHGHGDEEVTSSVSSYQVEELRKEWRTK